jgi:hypothetical protein
VKQNGTSKAPPRQEYALSPIRRDPCCVSYVIPHVLQPSLDYTGYLPHVLQPVQWVRSRRCLSGRSVSATSRASSMLSSSCTPGVQAVAIDQLPRQVKQLLQDGWRRETHRCTPPEEQFLSQLEAAAGNARCIGPALTMLYFCNSSLCKR